MLSAERFFLAFSLPQLQELSAERAITFTETKIRIFHMYFSLILEAEKAAQVSKIQFDQKIMEKESLRKMSEIEGELYSWFDVITSDNSNRDAGVNKLKEI